MTDVSFAYPLLLALLPLVGLLLLLRARLFGRQPARAVADLAGPGRAASVPSWRLRLRWLPMALRVLAVAFLVVAAARPQRGLALTFIPEEGIDVVVALDVSSSMNQRTSGSSLSETRLSAAQGVIDEFVEGLEGDRVALVTFRSSSLLLSPLTLDHIAFRRAVEGIDPAILPDGTAIGLGLTEALNLLRGSPARSQIVVLLTDGANNQGEVAPLEAARVAESLGVRVYTIGFHGLTRTGGVDVQVLQRIAETTDAEYYDASTRDELADAYEAIGALERSRVGERRFTSFEEFAPWLAGVAVLLLLVEVTLRAGVLRRYP